MLEVNPDKYNNIKSTDAHMSKSKLQSELHLHDMSQDMLGKLANVGDISKFGRIVDKTIKNFTDKLKSSNECLDNHVNESIHARNVRIYENVAIPTLEKFRKLTDIENIRGQLNKIEQNIKEKQKDYKNKHKHSEYIEGCYTALNALGEQLETLASMRDQSDMITRRDYARANPENIIKLDLAEDALKRLERRLDNEQFILDDAAGLDQEYIDKLKQRVKTCEESIEIVKKFQQSIEQDKGKEAWIEIQSKSEESESYARAANTLQEVEIEHLYQAMNQGIIRGAGQKLLERAPQSSMTDHSLVLAAQCQRCYEDCVKNLSKHLTKDQQIQDKFKEIFKKRYELAIFYKDAFDKSLKSLRRISESESDFREAVEAVHTMIDHPQLYDYTKWAPTDYTQVNPQNITNPNLVAKAVKNVTEELDNEQYIWDEAKGLGPEFEDKLEQRVVTCEGAKKIIEDFQQSVQDGNGEAKWEDIKQKSRKFRNFDGINQKDQESYEETNEARQYTFAANTLKKMEIEQLADQCLQYRDDSSKKLSQNPTQEILKNLPQERYELAMRYKAELGKQNAESESKFRTTAEELQLLANNPEKYIERFNKGKDYATSLLAGSKPKDFSISDMSVEELQLLADNPKVYMEWFDVENDYVTALSAELKPEDSKENLSDTLDQAAFNHGAHFILKDQLHLKELEHLNRKYHAVSENFSNLSEKLDQEEKQELEMMLYDTQKESKSNSELLNGILQVIGNFKDKEIIIEHWRKEDEEKKEYTSEKSKLSALKIIMKEYESKVPISILFQDIQKIIKHNKGKETITEKWKGKETITEKEVDSEGKVYIYTYENIHTYAESKTSVLEKMIGAYKAKVNELEKRIAEFSEKAKPTSPEHEAMLPPQQEIPSIQLENNKLTTTNMELLDQQEEKGPNTDAWLGFVTEARKEDVGKQMREQRELLHGKQHLSEDEIRKRLPSNIEQLKELWSALATHSDANETRDALNADIQRLNELLNPSTQAQNQAEISLPIIQEASEQPSHAGNNQEQNNIVEKEHSAEVNQSTQTIKPPPKAYIPNNNQ